MATEQHRLILNTQSVSTSPQSTWRPLNSYLRIVLEALTRIGVPTTFHVLPTGAIIHVNPVQGERSHLAEIIEELDALKRRADTSADYLFRPTKHAFRSARFYIFETYAKMADTFPRPSFVLDGEKGIIMKWVKNGHTVRLNCLAGAEDDDYIYFENGEYDIEDDVTPDTLKDRLNWLLNQHA